MQACSRGDDKFVLCNSLFTTLTFVPLLYFLLQGRERDSRPHSRHHDDGDWDDVKIVGDLPCPEDKVLVSYGPTASARRADSSNAISDKEKVVANLADETEAVASRTRRRQAEGNKASFAINKCKFYASVATRDARSYLPSISYHDFPTPN